MTAHPGEPARASWRRIPGGIWALGFVSLLMDVSSEMIHALLPIYMVATLGASTIAVGVIEGIAEATASIVKVFSGALSDRLGKRKLLALAGYGLGALTRPVFPLAPGIDWLIAARFVDRVGKGIRGAPRDALVADIAPPDLRGAAYGLRQSLDTIGAFAGPLAAIGLMWLFANDFQTVLWFAAIPACLSVAVLAFAVREPERPKEMRRVRSPLRRAELKRLGPVFWWVVAVASVFTLARFSEAFLILRAQSLDAPLALTPLVLVVMALAYMASAYPVGALSDRFDRTAILVAGLALLVVADLTLAFADGLSALGIGVALWGLHMGFTQGLLATLVADASPPELRGTAFGVFNLVTGVALLAASVLAGALWETAGPRATFLAGAAFAAVAALGLIALRRRFEAAASADRT